MDLNKLWTLALSVQIGFGIFQDKRDDHGTNPRDNEYILTM